MQNAQHARHVFVLMHMPYPMPMRGPCYLSNLNAHMTTVSIVYLETLHMMIVAEADPSDSSSPMNKYERLEHRIGMPLRGEQARSLKESFLLKVNWKHS